jgi:hypothetical protein
MRVIIMILLLADLCVHDLTNLSGEEHGITPRDKHDNAEVLMFVVDNASLNARASAYFETLFANDGLSRGDSHCLS